MILDTIKDIISRKKYVKDITITHQTRLKEDLGLDSFDAVELAIELEQTFNLKISDEAMQQFKIIQDVVDYIQKSLS
ncbi:MAG: acyl carrier protein [Candidatus Phytoplasma stylosanthis]|nr:acyl carrier protein [Candidatus Phytoplasma stylosanthis]MDV3170892.1 acyl carrier protein [Candidatus Phytoplasma stylosanthis]MDV3174072.1 acyl carrier protein [Candidatus Phytoplasma stylosanthis]MDV3196149.1 acyl carrier protein [Candidatus Phytoplasma stylosanthis]